MADGLHLVNTVDNSQIENAFAKMRKGIIDSAKTAEQTGKKMDAAFERAAMSIKGSGEEIKKKIYEESQTITSLSKKIIEQKGVVKDLQFEVQKIGDAYRKANKIGSQNAASLLAEYNAAKKALEEEKAALFALNQEKAKASVRSQELQNQLKLVTDAAGEAADAAEILESALKKTFLQLGGAAMVKKFVSDIVHVRGEFQQLEVAFKTMLGSEEKANDLMQQLTHTAAVTPFDLKGVTDGAKQLLAYGVAAEDVNDTLIHLGDIAAGLSLPLGDLVYLYGTTITQGRMFTQDLRQFMGRGIPIAEELAKQFGVTKDKVGELVTAGKVGADEFKKAIMSMSSEGGKFGGLMEEQSKTITGQISNLEDAIDNMYNEIGKQQEGLISDVISGANFIVEHYEQIGQALKTLVLLYGSYKAAIIAVAAIEKAIAAGRSLQYFFILTQRINAATAAQRAFNLAAMKNPYVVLGAAAFALVTTLAVLSRKQTEFDKSIDASNKKLAEQKETLAELNKERDVTTSMHEEASKAIAGEISKIETLQSAINDETNSLQDRRKAITQLQAIVPNYKASLSDEGVLYVQNKQAVDDYIASLQNLAIAKALQSKREELTSQRLNAELSRREAVKAEEDKRKAAEAAKEKVQAEQEAYNREMEKAEAATGGVMLAGARETQVARMGASQMNRIPLDKARQAERAANKELEVAANNVKILDTQIANATKDLEELDAYQKEHNIKPVVTTTTPTGGGTTDPKKDTRVSTEEAVQKELERLRFANRQAEIEQMEEGSEKKIAQIKLDYDREMAAIEEQRKKWKAANKKEGETGEGSLTQEQSDALKEATSLASKKMSKAVEAVSEEEVQKSKEKYNKLIEQYQTFDQKRRSIEERYQADMAVLQQHLDETEDAGEDISDIQATMQARTEAYKKEFQTLQSEILNSNDFFNKLFSDQSERGYKVLRDFYKQAEEVFNNAKIKADGVEISLPFKQEDGTYVKKQVNITLEEFERMKKQVKNIQKELEKQNPFAAFAKSWKDLIKSMKEDGDVTGALKKFKDKGKEVTGTIRSWGDSLGAVFGDRFSKSMDEIMDFCDGAMDLGTGIAQIWSGDIVGGITSALSGISQIVSLFTSWKEKMEEMKRQWYIAEIETNRALDERANKYAAQVSAISEIIKGTETLNWLIQQGYAKPDQVTEWQAYYAQQKQLSESLEKERLRNVELWEKVQSSNGYYEWGNSLNGGWEKWSLRGFGKEQIELWYNQNKLSDEARQYYEAWVASGKSVEELLQQLEECYQTMREMVMGVSFDGFLENSKEVLKKMRSDVSALADFTEETMQEALINAFMYQHLAEVLQPLYNELSENLIKEKANSDYLQNWKERYISTMKGANEQLDQLAKEMGIDLSDAYKQEASSKGFNAMSQETGEELNGRFTALAEVGYQISEKMDVQTDIFKRMETSIGGLTPRLDAMQTAIATSNIYLSDISKYTKNLIAISDTLERIENNTKHL